MCLISNQSRKCEKAKWIHNEQTDVCSLQGLSLRPVILYSLFEGLVLILRLFSILFAWTEEQIWKFRSYRCKEKRMSTSYLGPINLVRFFCILIGKKEINHCSWLHNHCGWHICKLKNHKIVIRGVIKCSDLLDNNLPMFNERPPCVARKLAWKPRHPETPPPRSTKFRGSLWKKDWRTIRQPL